MPRAVPRRSVDVELWRLSWLGIALALYVFMADSLRAVLQGLDVTRMLPQPFNWSVFVVALALMAAPVAHMAWRMSMEPVDSSDCREIDLPIPLASDTLVPAIWPLWPAAEVNRARIDACRLGQLLRHRRVLSRRAVLAFTLGAIALLAETRRRLRPPALTLRRHVLLSLFAVAAAALLFLFIGIHNAWDTVTYIALDHAQAPDVPAEPR